MTINRKIAGVLVAAALVVALPASAATTTGTAAQIQALFAQVAALRAQLALLMGGGTFAANLTVGSTGGDVTRLQQWLIGKGYAIPAGATGYFGEQTRGALAAYQAASGIVPAAGYFGPITRAKVNGSVVVTPPPQPPADDDDDDVSENDAEDAIEELDAAIDDAQDDIDEAEDDGEDVDDANDLLDDARASLADAEDALDDEEYEDAVDFADEGMDQVDEALDEIDADEDDEDTEADNVTTSANTTSVNGDDNDYATFRIELELTAFGEDIYIPQDADDAFTYRIEDASDGSTIGSATSESVSMSSNADEEGDYYVVREDDTERFTFTVVFNPLAADEGTSFTMQLLSIEYNDSQDPPDSSFSTDDNDYQTEPTYVND